MRTLRLLPLICCVLMSALACAETTATPPTIAPAQKPREEQAYLLKFISLEEEKGLVHGCGTAFPIGEHKLLTAEHCVHNEVNLSIKVGDEYHDCKVLKSDEEMDIAVIECPDATFTPIELTSTEAKEGKIVGCPEGDPVTSIAFINVDMHVKQTWIHTVFTTKVFTHGSSGSPLLGLDNKCIGMAVVMLEGRNGNFAGFLPSRRICQFLNEPEAKLAPKIDHAPAEIPPPKVPTPVVEPKKSSVQFR